MLHSLVKIARMNLGLAQEDHVGLVDVEEVLEVENVAEALNIPGDGGEGRECLNNGSG